MGYGDDEETALISSSNQVSPISSHTEVRRRSSRQRSTAANTTTRNSTSNSFTMSSNGLVVLLLLTASTIGMGVYFQLQVAKLQSQLADEQDHVAHMEELLGLHEHVIERFNSSVTNHDVIERLDTLQHDFLKKTDRVEDELAQTKRDVTKQLDATLDELSDTVAHAKRDIEEEVDKVKTDVEQYVLMTQDQFSMENSFMVYQLAGTFTLLTCLISMWHMTAHLRKMNEPDVQRKILAILWMSPIYAVTSWFSLVFHSAEGWLAIIKDSYEAYIIYQFLAFCIAVIGKGDRNTVVDHLSKHADHLTPPFRLFGCFEICGCCVPEPYENNRALADAILTQCQVFALQFVLFRPLTTIGVVVCSQMGYYGAGDGPADYRSPQFWFTVIQNMSIFTAFAGLLKFYHAVDSELAWCRPFAKFLCIKGVVFMTFWQGLAISTVATMTDAGGDDSEEWAKSAQNFLICIEMLAFSIAHFYCFPTDEWQEGYRVKQSRGAFGDSIALGDFFNDVRLILSSSDTKKGSNKKKKKQSSHEPIPEGDENYDDGADGSTSLTVTNGSSDLHDSQDDETVAASVSTAEENPQFSLARALEESLGLAGDDPDIIEAKERLLASNILRADFFDDLDDKGLNASFWQEHDNNSDSQHDDEPTYQKNYKSETTDADLESSPEPNHMPLYRSSSEEQEESTASDVSAESTQHETDEPLRPSVFTKIASIAESERQAARKEKRRRRRGQS